jgi:hypothetical protein
MTTNYQDLPNEELDRLAAERFLSKPLGPTSPTYWEPAINGGTIISLTHDPYDWDDFTPTHPDSNQAERYLFPKVFNEKTGFRIVIDYKDNDDIDLEIFYADGDIFENWYTCENNLNRCKIIASLEAWEKLNA